MVNNQSYTKKCYKCGYSETKKLPPLKKKLVYVDQFVISNIMNSLDKTSSKYENIRKDPYWIELYKLISKLVQNQRIICPYSHYHFKESISTPVFDKLKKIYKHISYNHQLLTHQQIFNFQVYKEFETYLSDESVDYDIEVIRGDYDKWEDRFMVSVDFNLSKEDIDALYNETVEIHKGFIDVIENNWRHNPASLKDSYQEEMANYGPAVVNNYIKQCSEFGKTTCFPGSLQLLFSQLLSLTKKYDIPETQQVDTINQFLLNGVMERIPYAYNCCYMFAALRQKVQSGMKTENISRGTNTDITAISSYLPYVDAIFVDNEQANYIRELTEQGKFSYDCKVFSTRTRDDFMKYLQEILDNTPKTHLTLVNQVYGDGWDEPFITILDK